MDSRNPHSVHTLFIGGWGRSGSTLLSRMLGAVDGYVCVGEIRDVFLRGLVENRVCGCGERFAECEFWGAVGSTAFGGWDQLDPVRLDELRSLVDKPWHLPAVRRKGIRSRTDDAVAEYGEILANLYRAMREVSGAKVIVDSSKIASFAALLEATPGIEPRFVHLVRDPRGTLTSWMKQVRMEDDLDMTRYMPRYSWFSGAARYVTYNAEMHVVEHGSPHVLLRYEDLVRNPETHLRRILELVGVNADASFSDFLGPKGVRLGLTHTVIGNPMRHQSGWIPLRGDDAWKQTMAGRQQAVIAAMTFPLMVRYGYELRP